MALKVDEGVYIFSAGGTVTYYPLNSQGKMLSTASTMGLTKLHQHDDGFIEAIQISNDRLLFVGQNSATVFGTKRDKVIIVSRTYAN